MSEDCSGNGGAEMAVEGRLSHVSLLNIFVGHPELSPILPTFVHWIQQIERRAWEHILPNNQAS